MGIHKKGDNTDEPKPKHPIKPKIKIAETYTLLIKAKLKTS